jgi:hypothetical protein
MSTKRPCEAVGAHHSTDRTDVYHGTTEPLHLCGYHASRYPDVTIQESFAVWSTSNADWYSVPDGAPWERFWAEECRRQDIDERPELVGTLEVRPYVSEG